MQIKLHENLREHVCTCVTDIDAELYSSYKVIQHTQDHIQALAESIKANGLHHALLLGVQEDGKTGLVGGFARYAAIVKIVKEAYPDTWQAELTRTYVPTNTKTMKDIAEAVSYIMIECQPRQELPALDLARAVYAVSQQEDMTIKKLALAMACTGRKVNQLIAIAKMFEKLDQSVGKELADRIRERAELPDHERRCLLFTELLYLEMYLRSEPEQDEAQQRITAILDKPESRVFDWMALIKT